MDTLYRRSGNVDIRIAINQAHQTCFSFQIISTVLNNAKCINPDKLKTKSQSNFKRVLKGFWEIFCQEAFFVRVTILRHEFYEFPITSKELGVAYCKLEIFVMSASVVNLNMPSPTDSSCAGWGGCRNFLQVLCPSLFSQESSQNLMT